MQLCIISPLVCYTCPNSWNCVIPSSNTPQWMVCYTMYSTHVLIPLDMRELPFMIKPMPTIKPDEAYLHVAAIVLYGRGHFFRVSIMWLYDIIQLFCICAIHCKVSLFGFWLMGQSYLAVRIRIVTEGGPVNRPSAPIWKHLLSSWLPSISGFN